MQLADSILSMKRRQVFHLQKILRGGNKAGALGGRRRIPFRASPYVCNLRLEKPFISSPFA